MSEIEKTSCVRNVTKVTPVSGIEREPWGAASALKVFNNGFYICTRSVKNNEYKCMKKHVFIFDCHFKTLHYSKYCGDIIV